MKIRKAKAADLEAVVAMLADDILGATREDYQIPLPNSYASAFEKIEKDKNQWLMVVESPKGEVVGVFQLTFIYYLTYQGGCRALIEGVRIKKDKRGEGLGGLMMKWAIDKAKEEKAHVVQLTTDKKRPESIIFYEKLGFIASHEGMKMHL